uniref:Capsid protein n=1 Tax=Xiangshan toli-like virus TaxID=2886239 RepID=A0A8K1YQL7_9VIRU|nr:MAG: hypothetical protein [Xiangshan toli-like virus]
MSVYARKCEEVAKTTSAMNLIAWQYAPPRDLLSIGQDIAVQMDGVLHYTQTGCRSLSAGSWRFLSLSYIIGCGTRRVGQGRAKREVGGADGGTPEDRIFVTTMGWDPLDSIFRPGANQAEAGAHGMCSRLRWQEIASQVEKNYIAGFFLISLSGYNLFTNTDKKMLKKHLNKIQKELIMSASTDETMKECDLYIVDTVTRLLTAYFLVQLSDPSTRTLTLAHINIISQKYEELLNLQTSTTTTVKSLTSEPTSVSRSTLTTPSSTIDSKTTSSLKLSSLSSFSGLSIDTPVSTKAYSELDSEANSDSEEETVLSRDRRAPGDLLGVYVNTIPARIINVSSSTTYDDLMAIQTSSRGTLLTSKMQNTDQASLGSIVRDMSVFDIVSELSILKELTLCDPRYRDLAPLLRARMMLLSVETQHLNVDLTIPRFVRDTTDPVFLEQTRFMRAIDLTEYTLTAMYQDTFTSYIQGVAGPTHHAIYDRSQVDKSWAVVPISASLVGSGFLMPMIASYFDSGLWNGTVNNRFICQDAPGAAEIRDLFFDTMPIANSVHIPGKNNLCLVLTGTSNARNNIQNIQISYYNAQNVQHVQNVPIWNGQGELAHLNVGGFFRDWWTNCPDLAFRLCDNVSYLDKLYNVHDTAGLSVSMASELFAVMHQGVYSAYENLLPHAGGTYAFRGNYRMGGVGPIIPQLPQFAINTDAVFRFIIEGYNRSATSPYHTFAFSQSNLNANHIWRLDEPEVRIPQYSVTEVSSIMRLAISLGDFSSSVPPFSSRYIVPNITYNYMLSICMAMNTAALLLDNDITNAIWNGWGSLLDHNYSENIGYELYKRIFGDRVIFRLVDDVDDLVPYFRESISEVFFGDQYNPALGPNLYVTSPVPCMTLLSWLQKLGIEHAQRMKPVSSRFQGNVEESVFVLKGNESQSKLRYTSSIDTNSIRFNIRYIGSGNTPRCDFGYWYDNWGFLTRCKDSYYVLNRNMFQTNTWTFSPATVGDAFYADIVLIRNTSQMSETSKWAAGIMCFPVSSTTNSIVSMAKNYTGTSAQSDLCGDTSGGAVEKGVGSSEDPTAT